MNINYQSLKEGYSNLFLISSFIFGSFTITGHLFNRINEFFEIRDFIISILIIFAIGITVFELLESKKGVSYASR